MFWPGASLRRYHGSNEVFMGVQTCVHFASLLKCQFNVAILFSGGRGQGGRGQGEGQGAGGRGRRQGGGGRREGGRGEGAGGKGEGGRGEGTGRGGICWCLRNRVCDEIA